jgi:hypothetical protein
VNKKKWTEKEWLTIQDFFVNTAGLCPFRGLLKASGRKSILLAAHAIKRASELMPPHNEHNWVQEAREAALTACVLADSNDNHQIEDFTRRFEDVIQSGEDYGREIDEAAGSDARRLTGCYGEIAVAVFQLAQLLPIPTNLTPDWEWRILASVRTAVLMSTDQTREAERLWHTNLVRELFGNPFKEPKINPHWLTWNDGVVEKLARTIYEDKKWGLVPILGDALEDAMCDDISILEHCRSYPATHVQGCWVVDLILGKE